MCITKRRGAALTYFTRRKDKMGRKVKTKKEEIVRQLEPKTKNQEIYIRNIDRNPVNFSMGPAGTGKTHVAIGVALQLYFQEKIDRIILSRPMITVDEEMGYLPGGEDAKLHPYMIPFFDELEYYVTYDKIRDMQNRRELVIAPIGTMRGRTFKRAFMILDEAQNVSKKQFKMFLSRMGVGSKIVVAGDPAQADLPNSQSGLTHAINRLYELPGVTVTTFGRQDIVRHPIVGDMLDRL